MKVDMLLKKRNQTYIFPLYFLALSTSSSFIFLPFQYLPPLFSYPLFTFRLYFPTLSLSSTFIFPSVYLPSSFSYSLYIFLIIYYSSLRCFFFISFFFVCVCVHFFQSVFLSLFLSFPSPLAIFPFSYLCIH